MLCCVMCEKNKQKKLLITKQNLQMYALNADLLTSEHSFLRNQYF